MSAYIEVGYISVYNIMDGEDFILVQLESNYWTTTKPEPRADIILRSTTLNHLHYLITILCYNIEAIRPLVPTNTTTQMIHCKFHHL